MWLKNDILGVFFDECRGGMPTRDSFGFINAVAVEIAYTRPFPFFQSLNDKKPHIKRHGSSKLVASGVMQRRGKITPHTYEMAATLNGNRLKLSYKLNVARTESVITSKMWLWTKLFQRCTIGESTFEVGEAPLGWHCVYSGKQPRSITLSDSGGELEIMGSTTPPVCTRVLRYGREKMEVAHGWAKGLLQKGTYSGELTLTYKKG